ncbi:MAG TPA: hypothetical protein PKC08_12145 [Pseudomonadales bacterium]|nr:hypothetical protein [Pseudomonadales bacterium]
MRVKLFVPILVLTLLVAIAPVVAMRPSPRQAQLARLRARATALGMRVQVDAAGTRAGHADYVLPWRLDEAREVRLRSFALERTAGAGWHAGTMDRGVQELARGLPHDLPAGAFALRSGADGLLVRWDEKGCEADVERIGMALRGLREALGTQG